jgi:general secretion pathway protein C
MGRFFKILNLLLVTIIVFFSVKLFYAFVIAQFDTGSPPEAFQTKMSSIKKEWQESLYHDNYSSIIERNLFGTRKEKPIIIANLKPTTMELRLWGTITGNLDRSYAIIEELKKNRRLQRQNLYREGDEVQSAVIKKILREKVILNVNGQDQILKIAEYRRAQTTTRKAIRSIRRKRTLKRVHIENAASNIKNLLSQANVKRHSDGLLLTRIRPNSIFRRMGLRNGDVITNINGRSIYSIEDALNIWEDLKESSNVNLGIKRRGRTRTIEYTIR